MDLRKSRSFAVVLVLLFSSRYEALGNEVSLSAGMQPLTDSEMDTYHGGFAAPGGLEINIGLNILTTASPMNGQIPPGMEGLSGLVASATLGNANGDAVLASLVQYTPNGGNVVIQNSLSNMTLQAMTQLNVDVANYSQLQGQLAVLGRNVVNSMSGLPR